MRIVHVISGLRLADGGPPRIAAGLARSLAQLDHEVLIIATNRLEPETAALNLEDVPGVTCTALPPGKSLTGFLLDGSHEFDIVHFHGVWNPAATRLSAHLRRRSIPYVVMPHGMLDHWSMSQKRLKKLVYLAFFERRALNGAAALHLANQHERESTAHLDISAPSFLLPNGVNPDEFDDMPKGGSFRFRFDEPAGTLLSYMARLHHKKGADLLVPAFCRLAREFPEAALVIAGPDEGLLPALERVVAKAGCEDRVQFPGLLQGDERLALLADTDIFCLTSRQEGHPMSVVEAAYVGLPCLLTHECHMPELSENDAAEFAELTVDSVEAKLRILLSDTSRRRAIAVQALDYAQNHYTWPSIAEQLSRYYIQILNNEF
jgi:glycosyltransferase involved in cell wall biosynthesis